MSGYPINATFCGAISREQTLKLATKNISKQQNELAQLQYQADTGHKYNDYVEISVAGHMNSLFSMDEKITQATQLRNNNQTVAMNMKETAALLETLNGIVNDIRDNLIIFEGGNNPQILKGYLGSIQTILNNQIADRALFSGYDTNSIAVGDIVNKSNLVDNIPTANYALASQEIFVYKINNSHAINTNIVAGDECFTNIIGAVHLALQGNGNIEQAEQMLNQGQLLLNARITEVENNYVLLETSDKILEDQEIRLQEEFDRIFAVDPFISLQLLREKTESIKLSTYATSLILKQTSIMDYM